MARSSHDQNRRKRHRRPTTTFASRFVPLLILVHLVLQLQCAFSLPIVQQTSASDLALNDRVAEARQYGIQTSLLRPIHTTTAGEPSTHRAISSYHTPLRRRCRLNTALFFDTERTRLVLDNDDDDDASRSAPQRLRRQALCKRGGNPHEMSRHLMASAGAAALAVGTATMGVATYSLRMHDWKTFRSDKGGDKEDKKEEKPVKPKEKGKIKRSRPAGPASSTVETAESGGAGSGVKKVASALHRFLTVTPSASAAASAQKKYKRSILFSAEEGEATATSDDSHALTKRGAKVPSTHSLFGADVRKFNKHAGLAAKVEDYGKIGASVGAFTAAVLSLNTAVLQHKHDANKAKKKEEEKKDEKDDKND